MAIAKLKRTFRGERCFSAGAELRGTGDAELAARSAGRVTGSAQSHCRRGGCANPARRGGLKEQTWASSKTFRTCAAPRALSA